MPTLFVFAGGEGAVHRLEETFYASVLVDPLLRPLFGSGKVEHVEHLTAFTAESFGGPDRFSRELGFAHLIAVHRGLRIDEAQRARFVELYSSTRASTADRVRAARIPHGPKVRGRLSLVRAEYIYAARGTTICGDWWNICRTRSGS